MPPARLCESAAGGNHGGLGRTSGGCVVSLPVLGLLRVGGGRGGGEGSPRSCGSRFSANSSRQREVEVRLAMSSKMTRTTKPRHGQPVFARVAEVVMCVWLAGTLAVRAACGSRDLPSGQGLSDGNPSGASIRVQLPLFCSSATEGFSASRGCAIGSTHRQAFHGVHCGTLFSIKLATPLARFLAHGSSRRRHAAPATLRAVGGDFSVTSSIEVRDGVALATRRAAFRGGVFHA